MFFFVPQSSSLLQVFVLPYTSYEIFIKENPKYLDICYLFLLAVTHPFSRQGLQKKRSSDLGTA